jgi:hypothetical protein
MIVPLFRNSWSGRYWPLCRLSTRTAWEATTLKCIKSRGPTAVTLLLPGPLPQRFARVSALSSSPCWRKPSGKEARSVATTATPLAGCASPSSCRTRLGGERRASGGLRVVGTRFPSSQGDAKTYARTPRAACTFCDPLEGQDSSPWLSSEPSHPGRAPQVAEVPGEPRRRRWRTW